MKPILFSTQMVQALLEGRKSMTRRVIKPQPHHLSDCHNQNRLFDAGGNDWACASCGGDMLHNAPYGKPNGGIHSRYITGDILWVRETWGKNLEITCRGIKTGECKQLYCDAADEPCFDDYFVYKADGYADTSTIWKPSIHMPREAARIFLRVTNVRAERLQDITEEDVAAEGTKDGNEYIKPKGVCVASWHVACFEMLWNSTLKEKKTGPLSQYRFCFNPWVWVYEFTQITKEEAATA